MFQPPQLAKLAGLKSLVRLLLSPCYIPTHDIRPTAGHTIYIYIYVCVLRRSVLRILDVSSILLYMCLLIYCVSRRW